jgi:hypothetical protein
MNMIAHYYPRIYNQSFMLYAIIDAVNQNIFIGSSRKNINPIDCGKCHEKNAVWVMEFKWAAHFLY